MVERCFSPARAATGNGIDDGIDPTWNVVAAHRAAVEPGLFDR